MTSTIAAAPPRLLDAHLHFWRIGGPGQSWPGADLTAICRDWGPGDLRAAAVGRGLAGGVLVQSQPDHRDTDWLLSLDDPLIRAVVGWVDLAAGNAPARIAQLATHPRLRGVRPMLQAIHDTGWIAQPSLTPAIRALVEHGLTLDALVQPRHLPVLHRFARAWPELAIVIDHGAKPAIVAGGLDPWRDQMAALAALPNVWCKLSGLRTEQAAGAPASELRPYVAHLVGCWGDRLMWGSDWPVVQMAGDTYGDWIDLAAELVGPQESAVQQRLFAGAAAAFYRIAT